jgi:3',5'-cyclic AMP phosphodiesterase CpdA
MFGRRIDKESQNRGARAPGSPGKSTVLLSWRRLRGGANEKVMNRRQFLVLSAAAASARAETPAEGPLISFGLLTDVQYADAEPEGERHYRESIQKLKDAATDLAKEKLPFSLHLGDVIDRDFPSFASVLPLFDGLGHPVRHLLGNHDYSIKDAEKDAVVKTLGMPADYYSFRSNGVRFVMLDTNDVSTYKHPQNDEGQLAAKVMMEKISGANNAKPWNGGASPAQLAWLEKELAEADAAKESALICGHHPLIPELGLQAWNSRAILELIDRHPSSRAYLCGHNHAGGEVIQNGIPYITLKSVLHQPGVTAYSVMRLFKDRLVIEGRGREISREVPLRAV